MSAIITLNDFKNYIGTQDINQERATTIVNGINGWVEAYTGRVWGETKTFTDTLDFEPVVFLTHIDIQTITKVEVFGIELSEGEYKVNKQTGRMLLDRTAERKYSRDDFDQVVITYTSGVATIPADLKQAVLQLTADNYNRRDDTDANVSSESLGGYSVAYGTASSKETVNSVMAVLNYYKVGRM